MITENQLQRIALAASALRPEWNPRSVLTILEKLATRPYRDLALAVAWVAADPDSKTPARVLEHGPWWMTTPEAQRSPQPPGPRDARCQTHPHEHATNCRGCAADKKATEDPHVPPVVGIDAKGKALVDAVLATRGEKQSPMEGTDV